MPESEYKQDPLDAEGMDEYTLTSDRRPASLTDLSHYQSAVSQMLWPRLRMSNPSLSFENASTEILQRARIPE